MSTQVGFPAIEYPESDGLPLGENMLQFLWITKLVGGLESLFRHDPNVLVAGDLFWYPTEGDNNTCTAPDAMVVFGRPKGLRASYKQWLEEGIAPQVVFEVLSPGNSTAAMRQKQQYYERFGVEEYYVVDPETPYLEGLARKRGTNGPDRGDGRLGEPSARNPVPKGGRRFRSLLPRQPPVRDLRARGRTRGGRTTTRGGRTTTRGGRTTTARRKNDNAPRKNDNAPTASRRSFVRWESSPKRSEFDGPAFCERPEIPFSRWRKLPRTATTRNSLKTSSCP